MLVDRDIPVLLALARYFLLTRHMVQALCYRSDTDGRLTRRRMAALCRDRYIKRLTLQVINPRDGAPSPVYILDSRGCQFLAEQFRDDRYLCKPTSVARPMHMQHYLAVARTHIVLDQAIDQSDVQLAAWFHEDEVVNPEESETRRQFKLYTELKKQPKLVCVPDAGFLLDTDGHRGVFYLEQDRDRSYSHKRVAATKSPGYAELFRRRMHRRHFPTTTLNRFVVIMIAPNDKRRDALRRAFKNKDSAELWRFAAEPDLSPSSFLHKSIWFRTDNDDPEPLVRLEPKESAQTEEAACEA